MPSSQKSQNLLATILIILLLILAYSSNVFTGPFKDTKVVLYNPLQEAFNIESSFNFVFNSNKLAKIVSDNLLGKEGHFAIYIEDLIDGEIYGFNQKDIFTSASLYKLYVLAAVLKEIEEGSIELDDILSARKKYLIERLGDTDFGYESAPSTVRYPIEEALERVGRISDNFAAIMLIDKVSMDEVQAMAKYIGTSSTDLDELRTSAEDTALYFKKLHLKQIVSETVSEEIEKYLLLNQLNNRIPALLPENTKVVHKTGELSRLRHDGGIVYLEGRPYIIVILSDDLKYEDEAVEVLAEISKDVYAYFKNKAK